ncbi:MAG: hypothetical protein J1F71_00020 [Clostridiales bacterium]|nr:hypothetical protein [Clostridiales bacterium]
MNNYYSIKSPADIDTFIEKTNALHDGHIVAVEYRNNGIKISGDVYELNSELKQLIIRVLITSIKDAVLEMEFENVLEWKISQADNDILEAGVSFDEKGFIVWADGAIDLNNVQGNDSYVIAKKMKWRIL